MDVFVTAIGTDSGKTLVSAILVEALNADYWKPIQAGLPRDTDTVQQLVGNSQRTFWSETYLLNTPASPHASAKIDQVEIDLMQINKPRTPNNLVIEGAGGLLVPINDNHYVIDIARKLQTPILLVCNLYLGSINHSLLSIEYLKQHKLEVAGIIFNGLSNPESEKIIASKSPWPVLLHVQQETIITKEKILKYASRLKGVLK